jgi:hypothetical protein
MAVIADLAERVEMLADDAHPHNENRKLVAHLLSPATFDEHQGDTITEHRFVNVLSPSCSSW